MPQAKHAYITPRLSRALPSTTRQLVVKAVQAHIDAQAGLIAFLDQLDGDPDLEPSLGSNESADSGGTAWGQITAVTDDREDDDEREEECEDEGADSDLEPSLGSTMGWGGDVNSQLNWADGHVKDLEEEHDGSEDGGDSEPMLGAGNTSVPSTGFFGFSPSDQERLGFDQTGWAECAEGESSGSDLEEEHDGTEPDGDDEMW